MFFLTHSLKRDTYQIDKQQGHSMCMFLLWFKQYQPGKKPQLLKEKHFQNAFQGKNNFWFWVFPDLVNIR